jgi:phosphoserine phosphatase
LPSTTTTGCSRTSQTIAVGDSANDVPMLEKAGLGIAFRAGLDAILYLLGISAEELQDATAQFG